jgi:hypothetical protein
MNEEQTTTEQPVDAPPAEVVQRNDAPTRESQSQEPRRRLRELTAIPDRDRTDAVWDEIIELEIQLAPGNRALSPQAENGRRQEPGRRPEQQQGRRPEQARRQGQGQQGQGQDPSSRSKPGGRFFKKRKRGPGAPA